MRNLIMNKGGRCDIDSLRPDIDAIVAAFDRYLDEYPVKTAKSMHSLLGPVPMILDGARVRKESVQTLVGRAVRAHEMNPRTKGYLAPSALTALESATTKLLELCNDRERLPITGVTKVTERIRYSVYYVRRKKGIEWLEKTRVAFADFLRTKYSDNASLVKAWGESDVTLDGVRFPSQKNDAYKRANPRKKTDIDEFHQLKPDAPAVEEEDDNE